MGQPRVFAVQQPTGRDEQTGEVIHSMDLSPAESFGELRFILRDNINPFRDLDAAAQEVERVLEESVFGADDWLLLVGNPVLIGVVSAIAAQFTGELRLLQWNRVARAYRPVCVNLPGYDEAA